MSTGDWTALPFMRLEGCGNHFLVIYNHDSTTNWRQLAPKLLDSHFGMGGDGIMLVSPLAGSIPFQVQMFNPDGSESGMCGNGVRCVARFLVLMGKVPANTESLKVKFGMRELTLTLEDEGRLVTVDMGAPVFEPDKVPVKAEHALAPLVFEIEGLKLQGVAISMGNPHCVIEVPDVAKVPLSIVGPKIENDPRFPERTNVEFFERVSSTKLLMRVWERGAGATLACGSGVCATAVAARLNGLIEEKCTVEVPGGILYTEWQGAGSSVFLTGPASEIASGNFFPQFLSRVSAQTASTN